MLTPPIPIWLFTCSNTNRAPVFLMLVVHVIESLPTYSDLHSIFKVCEMFKEWLTISTSQSLTLAKQIFELKFLESLSDILKIPLVKVRNGMGGWDKRLDVTRATTMCEQLYSWGCKWMVVRWKRPDLALWYCLK